MDTGIGPAAAARIAGARPLRLPAFHRIAGTTPVDHLWYLHILRFNNLHGTRHDAEELVTLHRSYQYYSRHDTEGIDNRSIGGRASLPVHAMSL